MSIFWSVLFCIVSILIIARMAIKREYKVGFDGKLVTFRTGWGASTPKIQYPLNEIKQVDLLTGDWGKIRSYEIIINDGQPHDITDPQPSEFYQFLKICLESNTPVYADRLWLKKIKREASESFPMDKIM